MPRLLQLCIMHLICGLSIWGQHADSANKDFVMFLGKLQEATYKSNLKFLESAFAPEYVYTTASGTTETKVQALEFLGKVKAESRYKVLKHEMKDRQIQIVGDIAVVTGSWRLLTEFKNAHPDDPPHVDEGRYTGVFHRRGGRWFVLTEHDSDKPHDSEAMEKQVAALGRAYTDMIRRHDAAAISKLLADDYIVTDEEGNRLTKEQDLATYNDRAKTITFTGVEYLDQKVRMITGSIAIDHSTIRFTGSRSGTPFDITERITTTWQFRDGRWLIVADHFSFVKP